MKENGKESDLRDRSFSRAEGGRMEENAEKSDLRDRSFSMIRHWAKNSPENVTP